MAMSKKDFIALADAIREHHAQLAHIKQPAADNFTMSQLEVLASFCKRTNPNFKRDRWLSYIAGECRPNGGAR